jgi:DNA-binding MarR family transcriptional regulator
MVVEATSQEILQRTIDHFWETIPPVWNSVRSNVRSIATDIFDISVEQFHILRHVRKGITSVSELAAIRQISRPAVSQAINVLVERDLLTRHQSVDDRRYVELKLTQSGNELLNAIFENNRAWMLKKLSDLQQSEITCLMNSMEVLKKVFVDPES